LPIIEVIKPKESKKVSLEQKKDFQAYEGEGVLINSGCFNGLESTRARERITEWLFKKKIAKKAVYYKLRDWIFSRQRYWGEPIPVVYCRRCWERISAQNSSSNLKKGIDYVVIDGKEHIINLVPEKDLPVKLPRVKDYIPTEKGDSPLAKVKSWVNVRCPKCGGPAKRETDVMPNWAGSNWYYLRYCDPENDKKLADPKLLKYWMPVDWYNGGMEHTTLHLLYSRFIYKFLWDIGAVPRSIGQEPYKKRTSQGMILAEGGVKMSKSKGNIINPDKVIKQYGADALRVYEMFMGPFEQAIPWDTAGLKGVRRFLDKVWKIKEKVKKGVKESQDLKKMMHRTIKKVGEDIESLKFNTAVSSLMVLTNELEKQKEISLNCYSLFLILLSPFAPHLSEELWQKMGFKGLCCQQKWPKYNQNLIKKEIITLMIEVNGKVRDKVETKADINKREATEIALSREKVKKWINGKKIKDVIFVPGRLINFVV